MTGQVGPKPRRQPGLGSALAAVLFLSLLAGVRYEWWRFPSPFDFVLELATVWLGILGLVAVGTVWIVRAYKYWQINHRLTWLSVIVPVLIVAGIAGFAVVDIPAKREFNQANSQMEELAISVLRDGRQNLGPTVVGGVYFTTIYVGNDNCVYFIVGKRGNSLFRAGWVYTDQCSPDPKTFRELDTLDDNWAEFEQGS
ncbi:MAG: hypothetical protein ACOH2Q_06600 [Rhodococcus sp. (in: high G+C Gram-positive bacteria)]